MLRSSSRDDTHAHGHRGFRDLRGAPLDTPIGDRWITISERGLYSISREPVPSAALDPDAVTETGEQLTAYFRGRAHGFDLELDYDGASPFDVAVWEAARSTSYGETISYGDLAALAGRPGAARAAGGSMARCRLTPVVPCHRVIHADGAIGGWGDETWVKRWLLDLERGGSWNNCEPRSARIHAR